MTTAQTFQIVRISPVYHCTTDAMIGSKADRLPMAYSSEALAHKLAGRWTDEDYRNYGDDHFVVVPYGASPFSEAIRPTFDAFADMPF